MTKNEFLQLQNDFADKAYNYDRIYKRGLILDQMYTLKFYDLMCEQIRLSEENKMIENAVKMHYENESAENIDKYIGECKANYNSIIANFSQRKQLAEIVVTHTNNMTEDDKRNLEDSYKEFSMKNHPGVRMSVSQEYNELYVAIRKFYNENNYTGFMSVLEMNSGIIDNFEVKEEDYETYKEYYYNASIMMTKDLEMRTQQYPYTLEEVFEDEITMAREEGQVRADISRFLGVNKSYHADFINVFGHDENIDR